MPIVNWLTFPFLQLTMPLPFKFPTTNFSDQSCNQLRAATLLPNPLQLSAVTARTATVSSPTMTESKNRRSKSSVMILRS